jgi:hypothetical protein
MGGIPTPEAAAIINAQLHAASAGWRPIETAPKNGTPVLLWTTYSWDWAPVKAEAVTARWHYPGGIESERGYWALIQMGGYAEDDDVTGEPTHWMPLPGGPE